MNNVLPSIRCSRNLRRRTGFMLGLEKTELAIVVSSGSVPALVQKLFALDHIPWWWTVGTLGVVYTVIATFKFGKQPNYPTLWWRNNFDLPPSWRAPKPQMNHWPITE